MVLSARPERQPVPSAPREVVARMSLNGLEQAGNDPDVDGDDVEVDASVDEGREVGRGKGKKQRATNRASAENQNLERVSVLGRETEGSRELVVELVDVLDGRSEPREDVSPPKLRGDAAGARAHLVKHGSVQPPVGKVVERVLKDEEEGDLPGDRAQSREGD